MTLSRLALTLATLMLCLGSSACVTNVDYHLANETGYPVKTWASSEPCHADGRTYDAYFDLHTVPSGATFEYEDSDAFGTTAKCVIVVDAEERLLIAQPYERAKTYEVSDSAVSSHQMSTSKDILSIMFGLASSIMFGLASIMVGSAILVFGLAILLVLLAGPFVIVRWGYRRLRGPRDYSQP